MSPPAQTTLFTIPIPDHKSPEIPSTGGYITVSRLNITQPTTPQSESAHSSTSPLKPKSFTPQPPVYLLIHHSPPDNRLTSPFCTTYRAALLRLLHSTQPSYPRGILLTTSSLLKFYSNGLDLSTFTPTQKQTHLYPLWRTLLTYPMPTCAIINGHAFAGGFLTAMFHDYRIMNPHRGYLCMNELEFDAELASGMYAVFLAKVRSDEVLRGVLLEAKRWTALGAVEAGLVDGVGGVEEAVGMMRDVEGGYGRGAGIVVARGRGGVYGRLKEGIYADVVRALEVGVEEEREAIEKVWRRRREWEEEEKVLVDEAERKGLVKAKL